MIASETKPPYQGRFLNNNRKQYSKVMENFNQTRKTITQKEAIGLLRCFGGISVNSGGLKYLRNHREVLHQIGPHSLPIDFRNLLRVIKSNFPKKIKREKIVREKKTVEPTRYSLLRGGPIRFIREDEDKDIEKDTLPFQREEVIMLSVEDFEIVEEDNKEVDLLLNEDEKTQLFIQEKIIEEPVQDQTQKMETIYSRKIPCQKCQVPKFNIHPVSGLCLICRRIYVSPFPRRN